MHALRWPSSESLSPSQSWWVAGVWRLPLYLPGELLRFVPPGSSSYRRFIQVPARHPKTLTATPPRDMADLVAKLRAYHILWPDKEGTRSS